LIASAYHYSYQAILTITASKLRSFLAVLGILVGTAAIVALISCSQLATQKALAEFKALGTNLIAISVYQQQSSSSLKQQPTIALDTWRQFPHVISDILLIAPYNTAFQSIYFKGHVISGNLIGADDSLANVLHINMKKGRFVSFVESYEHVCVIGANIADQIKKYNMHDPIGQQIQIERALYTVVGVAKPWAGNEFFNGDINQSIILPIKGLGLISKDIKINNAIVRIKSNSDIDPLIEQIKQYIAMHSPTLTVFVRSAKQIIVSMENQSRVFTLLLAVIGSISLLVGGIGVMNVMLVSVNERKKEIGIRKAVGAKNSDIQMLFLIESIFLSFLGGVLGVIIGLLLTWIIAYFSHWPFSILFMPLIAGFGVSVMTGIFFGFYPARRAARMQPVESLRSE
jgi:putative ABC transport system permease protein